ncbi:hypothetical protein [Streptomyces pseudovenezuelae]|uniref:Uncharacterized protein n=1 Tax=Streptomyces pseudovenezuelae TaxID=67350 RepID=A0ABZ1WX39_9ACTN|nr:hypothetical protein [Streptomyces pseudovenezuelae]
MTQSGQGEQPSAREAREGIVLPSDGGEPLLPGQTGGYGSQQPGYGPPQQGGYGGPPQAGRPGPAADAGYGQPPVGQAWGTPWGPEQQQDQAQQQDQTQHQTQQQPQDQTQHWPQPPAQTWGAPEQPGGIPPQSPAQSQPLPAPGYDTNEPTSYYLPPVGQPAPQSQPLPPQQGQVAPYEAPGSGAPQQQATPGYRADEPTSYYLPPVGQPLPSAPGTPASAPLPPADEGATQFIPPVAAGPAAHEGATQYLPPVRPGELPPEVSAEAARFPGQYPQAPYGAQNPAPGPAGGPDAEATQFIAPVPGQAPGAAYGGERQPPSDFDNLFRSDPGGDGGAASTQQMPRFAQPEAVPPAYGAQQPPYGAQQPSYGAQPPYGPPGAELYDDGDRGGRKRSRVPVIAAVGIGIVVLGIGAGALLAGGGGSGDGGDKNQTVSATAPATDGSSSPAADPAKAQAVELDKLLADSGNSRSSVISAVANVKSCKNLGQAAQDLRNAAAQRTGLVTRLKGLSVDRLASHAELTDALTRAWQASASADNHYAAWADQSAGKKGCKKGQARATGQTQAGNRDSGTASTEKAKAARLWNAIARKYSLTERTATQL